MNWNLIWWFAGIVATFYGLKFVLEFFKSMFGKESREAIMSSIGDSISSTNKKITKAIKKKAAARKQQKEEEKRAIVRVL
jgi:hypothetical protein